MEEGKKPSKGKRNLIDSIFYGSRYTLFISMNVTALKELLVSCQNSFFQTYRKNTMLFARKKKNSVLFLFYEMKLKVLILSCSGVL